MPLLICEGCAEEMITRDTWEKQNHMCDACYEKYLNKSIPHIKKKEKKHKFMKKLDELRARMTA